MNKIQSTQSDESMPYFCGFDLLNAKWAQIRSLMQKYELDGILLFDSPSVRYVSGFYVKGYRTISMDIEYLVAMFQSGPPVLGFVSGSDSNLVKMRCPIEDTRKLGARDSWAKTIAAIFNDNKVSSGIIGTDLLPFDVFAELNKLLPSIKFVTLGKFWADMTAIKLPIEIEYIREAVKIAEIGMKAAINAVKAGVKEREVAAEGEYAMRRSGSEMIPYLSQVSSGRNAAIFERISTEKVIKNGELVIVDLGAIYKGYLAEFARTVIVGNPTEEQRKIFTIQLKSLNAGISLIGPGIKASEVDQVTRDVISEEGYGKYMHKFATGHQLGYGIHGEPLISKNSDEIIKPNMVINLEPRVTLFDQPSVGGVANEDTLVITESGKEKLTNVDYDERLILE